MRNCTREISFFLQELQKTTRIYRKYIVFFCSFFSWIILLNGFRNLIHFQTSFYIYIFRHCSCIQMCDVCDLYLPRAPHYTIIISRWMFFLLLQSLWYRKKCVCGKVFEISLAGCFIAITSFTLKLDENFLASNIFKNSKNWSLPSDCTNIKYYMI